MAVVEAESFDELRRKTVADLEAIVESWTDGDDTEIPSSSTHSPSRLSLYWEFGKNFEEEDEGEENFGWHSSELTQLQKCSKESADVLSRLNDAKNGLDLLVGRYQSVADRTSSLHEACDQLMADQTRLASAAEEIRSKLSYFERVDQISQKLHSPQLSVTGESFAAMLNTIDECILFLQTEKDFKEAGTYLGKYQQCLSRALSLVKNHIIRNLNSAKENIELKLKEDPSYAEETFTLYYGMFATHAQTIHAVMQKLEGKWDRHSEYQSVLTDCYQAYFRQRDLILRPSVSATVNTLLKKHAKSCCTLTRTGCSFLLRLCEDEYRLFFQFFSRPTDLLHDFTERLCRIFHDALRPLVIHIPHLENLTELCSILKNEFLEDRCSADREVYGGFVRIGSELLGDVEERLVYRSHMYAQSDIQGYVPAPGDLAYPEKLHMMQEIAKTTRESNAGHSRQPSVTSLQSVGSNSSAEVAGITSRETTSAADLHGLWYPTVRRTVLCLSKLYRCLDSSVFQGLSQDILNMCVESLHLAKGKIAVTKKPLDAQLFFVKHLLILREQTSPFRGNLSVKEAQMDFSKIKDSAYQLFNQKSRWFALGGNNAFLELLLQVPAHVSEHVVDTRRVLDLQLRDACQQLINQSTQDVALEINDFYQKADVIAKMVHESGKEGGDASKAGGNPMSLRQQPFAKPEALQKLVSQAYRKLKDYIPLLRASFNLYIGNKDTENILFTPIKKNIHTSFQKLSELVGKEYTEEEQQVVAFPSLEQINLLLSATPTE